MHGVLLIIYNSWKVYKNYKHESILSIWSRNSVYEFQEIEHDIVRNLFENVFIMPIYILRFQNKYWYNWANGISKNFIKIIILFLIHVIAMNTIDLNVVELISCPHM